MQEKNASAPNFFQPRGQNLPRRGGAPSGQLPLPVFATVCPLVRHARLLVCVGVAFLSFLQERSNVADLPCCLAGLSGSGTVFGVLAHD